MAQIPDSVRVTGAIAPSDDTDAYPSHDSIWGRGGHREVADIPARDAIPSDRQRVGMLVYVEDSDGLGTPETYRLDIIGDPGTYSVAFPGVTSEWVQSSDLGPPAQDFLRPTDGAGRKVSIGTATIAPTGASGSDPGAFLRVEQGHIEIKGTNSGAWDGPHFVMGPYHFWVDSSGNLRMKNGAPASDTDGITVGMQSP